jgi:hypothetical protein
MATCEMTDGCVWDGNPNNGSCVEDVPVVCANIDNMQQCNMAETCSWNNQMGVCEDAA